VDRVAGLRVTRDLERGMRWFAPSILTSPPLGLYSSVRRDVKSPGVARSLLRSRCEIHVFDSSHLLLETHAAECAELMARFGLEHA
jgi:hypothetical protein